MSTDETTGTDEASIVDCQVCKWEQPPRGPWGAAGFDVAGALNSLLALLHSSHERAEQAKAALLSRRRLSDAVSPTFETLAQCEQMLRDGGFTDEEIAVANLDGGDAKSVAERVSKRAAEAAMLHFAAAAGAQAQELFWCSEDPARDVGLRVVKLALLAMAGRRGAALPPLDCLKELGQLISGQPDGDGGGDADKRRLMAILSEEEPHIRRSEAAAAQRAPSLVRGLQAAFGEGFAVEPAECESILLRFFNRKIKKLTGVAAELVLTARAWGYVREEGNPRNTTGFLQDLAKARGRDKRQSSRDPDKAKKERAKTAKKSGPKKTKKRGKKAKKERSK